MNITKTVGGVGFWQTKAHMEKNPQVPSVLYLAGTMPSTGKKTK